MGKWIKVVIENSPKIPVICTDNVDTVRANPKGNASVSTMSVCNTIVYISQEM